MTHNTPKVFLNRRDLMVGASSLLLGVAGGATSTLLADKAKAGNSSLARLQKSRRGPRKRISIGILGQSNEQNRVPPSEARAQPGAFRSKYNSAVLAPQMGNVVLQPAGGAVKSMAPFGGMWFGLYDRLWELGYDAAMVNGAIGSASMVRDFAGSTVQWRPTSSGYYQNRVALGASGDLGDAGSIIVAGNPSRIFRCVEGRRRYALLEGHAFLPGTKIDKIDYITTTGKHKSGKKEPNWDSLRRFGDELFDGDLVWRLEADNNIGLKAAQTGRGGCHQIMGHGYWDPLGMVRRLTSMMMSIQHVEERWIILQNGQSDYGGSPKSQMAYQQGAGEPRAIFSGSRLQGGHWAELLCAGSGPQVLGWFGSRP